MDQCTDGWMDRWMARWRVTSQSIMGNNMEDNHSLMCLFICTFIQ